MSHALLSDSDIDAVSQVRVVIAPGLVADRALLGEVAEREFAALGVRGVLIHAHDAAEVRAQLPPAPGGAGALVILPGPEDETRELMRDSPDGVVWLDLARVGPVPGAAHIQGRGVEGLAWAIRHAVHRRRRPPARVPYGGHPDQRGELYLPETDGPHPVVALVHGGYWRSIWGADLMDALCADLAGRGFAAWNLEYRRPDLHGWDVTTADVAAGLAALADLRAPLDLDRVAVAGHSAGAQLALRAAADGARVALAVSLAGVLDLVEADRRHMSTGAVSSALGATAPAEVYLRSCPLLRLPLGVPQLIVQGSGDDLDLVDFGRRYARAASESGDEVTYLEMSGDHFAVIDPAAPIWRTTALAIAKRLDHTGG